MLAIVPGSRKQKLRRLISSTPGAKSLILIGMLLKIEGMCRPRWQFTPGVSQGGDGPSRSPPDGDQAREAQEQRTSLPRTLAEAFTAMVTAVYGTMLHAQSLVFNLLLGVGSFSLVLLFPVVCVLLLRLKLC